MTDLHWVPDDPGESMVMSYRIEIATDEQRAQAVPQGQRVWHHDDATKMGHHQRDAGSQLDLGGGAGSALGVDRGDAPGDETTVSYAEADHIATWDPKRALAECDAKRRIIEVHHAREATGFDRDGEEHSAMVCDACSMEDDPCPTLRLLALPYADRPGCREEWRP